jgi:hypothetical protein
MDLCVTSNSASDLLQAVRRADAIDPPCWAVGGSAYDAPAERISGGSQSKGPSENSEGPLLCLVAEGGLEPPTSGL